MNFGESVIKGLLWIITDPVRYGFFCWGCGVILGTMITSGRTRIKIEDLQEKLKKKRKRRRQKIL